MENLNMANAFLPSSQPNIQQPPVAPAYSPKAEEIVGGHKAIEAAMNGLISLVSKPKGDLSKKDVFDAASGMIAHGAFSTSEAKQQLIGELANLPDDEPGIRKMLGQYLLQISEFQNHFHNAFGPPSVSSPLAGVQ